MPKYIPGNPGMIVSNMPAAGSNAAVAHIYNVAPKDGTFIGAPQNSAIMDALFDATLGNARRLRHDATKLIHIGSATTDHYVCIARSDAPIKTFKQALTQEFLIGASSPARPPRLPGMLNNTTGAKIKQVSGYPARAKSRSRSRRTKCTASAASPGRACRRRSRTGSSPLHPRDRPGA